MEDSKPTTILRLGDAYAFVDDGVIMLKSVDRFGDPVELTEQEALRLARWLISWSTVLGDGPV